MYVCNKRNSKVTISYQKYPNQLLNMCKVKYIHDMIHIYL